MEKNTTIQSLSLSNHVFNVLLNNILYHFKKRHQLDKENYTDYQLYGFGNFDFNKPSLKNDFESILKGYVNGKYLYNKYREAISGKPIIKINKDYKYLLFSYINYKDVNEFIEKESFTYKDKNLQLELLRNSNSENDCYYTSYYFGEDNKITKGQVIIYNDWKKVKMIYQYGNKDLITYYTFYGVINHSEDFIFLNTKYYVKNTKSEGAKFIFFIGKSSPNERSYLIGTYSGFDKYDRAIAGKIILKKHNSKIEMEEEVNNEFFNPIICQEINKNRIVVESNLKKNPLKFSKKSPFSEMLLFSNGEYIFNFKDKKKIHSLKLKIEKFHYNIISLNKSIIIEEDKVSILNKGQVLYLDFLISGMFYMQKLSIYFDLSNLINTKKTKGNFNGFTINNEIISGEVEIKTINK